MAALSSKVQENYLTVVDALSLSISEADACLRVELEDIKAELSDLDSHFVRRRQFRDRVYAALDGDVEVFKDADGNLHDADAAVDAVMHRLRKSKIDMLSLFESTRVSLRPMMVWEIVTRKKSDKSKTSDLTGLPLCRLV